MHAINHLLPVMMVSDLGVRKFALKTVEAANITSLKEKVRSMNTREVNPEIKALGENVFKKL